MLNIFKCLSYIQGSIQNIVKYQEYKKDYNDLKSKVDLLDYKFSNFQMQLNEMSGNIVNNTSFTLKNSYQVEMLIEYGLENYKSYSQYHEDVVIKHIFNKLNIENPTYLDVGAHDPIYLSNTALLYETGSRGINVEPNPEAIKKFNDLRGEDRNLNIGVHSVAGSLDFHVIKGNSTYNTFSKEQVERLSKFGIEVEAVIPITVRTVREIVEENDGVFPDFFSLDVEGLDYEILKSIDFSKSAPKVVCVEINFHGVGGRNIKIDQLLNSNGYFLYADVQGNSLYVQEKYLNQLM